MQNLWEQSASKHFVLAYRLFFSVLLTFHNLITRNLLNVIYLTVSPSNQYRFIIKTKQKQNALFNVLKNKNNICVTFKILYVCIIFFT